MSRPKCPAPTRTGARNRRLKDGSDGLHLACAGWGRLCATTVGTELYSSTLRIQPLEPSCTVVRVGSNQEKPAGTDECLTCHQSDYDSQHGQRFPETCLDCHNQSTWDDASFDHDAAYFPIYSGEHRGEWSQCSDCHRSAPLTYATFSCIDCHEHSQSRMNNKHDDVTGYVWDSIACLSCHPNGRE